MKVIRANCRVQFTPQDIAFLIDTLTSTEKEQSALTQLLGDEESRNQVLDSQDVFNAVLEEPSQLPISQHLFFYVLVRRVLTQASIENELVADYVAEVLAEFTRSNRHTRRDLNTPLPLDKWLQSLEHGRDRVGFELRAYLANHLLFITGIQEDWLRQRTERRGAPRLEFYESFGPKLFQEAGQHSLAQNYDLEEVFEELANRFHDTRVALNDLSTRLLHLDSPAVPVINTRADEFGLN